MTTRPAAGRRAAFLAACLLAAPCGTALGAEPAPDVNLRCGEDCLRVALPGLGFADDAVAAALEHLGPAPGGGHALADLAAAVEAAGGHALAVETAADRLRARQAAGDRFACVAHVDGNHYALIAGFTDDGAAEVFDPPEIYTLPPETLAARWDGRALLIARDPLTPEADLPGPFPWRACLLAAAGLGVVAGGWTWLARRSPRPTRPAGGRRIAAAALVAAVAAVPGCDGAPPAGGVTVDADAGPPRAVFATLRQDAGTIPITPVGHVFAFPLTNRGGTDLHVTGLTTSCGCTDATVTADVIPPGGTAEVRAVITPKLPEARGASVTVATDDPDAPGTTLTIDWRAVAPWTPEPADLDFGPLRPGETAERTVRLVRHAVAGGHPAGTPAGLDVGGNAALAAAWADAEPAGDGGDGDDRAVRVRLTAPAELGRGSGVVAVGLTGGWVESLPVPVRYEVRDAVTALPPRAFLGSGPPGADRRVRVQLVGAGPLEVTEPPTFAAAGSGAAGPLDGLSVTTTRLAAGRVVIDLAGPLPAAAGPHAGALTVGVRVTPPAGPPEDRTVVVPVSAFVAGESAAEGADA